MKFAPVALAALVTWSLAAPAAAGALPRTPAYASTRGSFAGSVAPGTPVSILVRLSGQRDAELDRFVAELQSPDNLNPRYLTPQEFGAYFGANPVVYARAIATLRLAGFVIDDLPANRTDIVAHAPAARVAALFGTPIDRRIERGRMFFTTRYEPLIPASLGAVAISGLDDYVQFHPLGLHRSRGGVRGGWTPDDIAGAYDLNPLYKAGFDGKGVTIANATACAATATDLATFQAHFRLPIVPLVSTPIGGPLSTSCGAGYDNLESSLDADSATSIARGATFHQVVAKNTSNHDFDLAYEYIVNRLGDVHVVTTSWGICERDLAKSKSFDIDEALFKQAIAEGQFWFSASGDNGTDDCNDGGKAVSVDFPGSSPQVIGVGGTNVQGSVGKGGVVTWTGETTWQYSNSDGASGGGKSIEFAKPAYQAGATPEDGARDVPDVALIADYVNDGVYYCLNGSFALEGGTSEASPMWAGFLAIVEQVKHGKKFVDPHVRLYQLGKSAEYDKVFHDITSGNNGVPLGDDPYYPRLSFPGYNAAKGFDLTTGWGSFIAEPLAMAY